MGYADTKFTSQTQYTLNHVYWSIVLRNFWVDSNRVRIRKIYQKNFLSISIIVVPQTSLLLTTILYWKWGLEAGHTSSSFFKITCHYFAVIILTLYFVYSQGSLAIGLFFFFSFNHSQSRFILTFYSLMIAELFSTVQMPISWNAGCIPNLVPDAGTSLPVSRHTE